MLYYRVHRAQMLANRRDTLMNEGIWEDLVTGEYWFEFDGSDSDENYYYVAIEDPQPDNPPVIGALFFFLFPIGWKRLFKPVGPPKLARPPKLRRPKPPIKQSGG